MNIANKRKDMQQGDNKTKRIRQECDYGERCYRRNPAHFREFTHRHLEAILDTYSGTGPYPIPDKYDMDRVSITEQLDVIVEKQLYMPWVKADSSTVVANRQSERDKRGNATDSGSSKTLAKPQEKLSTQNTFNVPSSSSTTSSLLDTQRKPLKGILKNSPLRPQNNLQEIGVSSTSEKVPLQNMACNKLKNKSESSIESHSGSNSQTLNKKDTLNQKGSSGGPQRGSLFAFFNKVNANDVENSNNSPQQVQSNSISQNTQPLSHGDFKNSQNIHGSHNRADSTSQGSQNVSPISHKTSQGPNVRGQESSDGQTSRKQNNSDYRPVVLPTRRVEDFLNVVVPKGKMAAKHAASAPYHIFYTTITAARETHNQPYSITFQEILDHSLGELKCSLQINFMVELGWLLAQYYFAGYSAKKLTILYGEDSPDLQTISQKKPHVDAHMVRMSSPFGKHHTKMMLLCYEDGSLRVVVSTANLYIDDWENRTQGLWFSPRCPELPADAMPHAGDSPTMFKRTLLRYLANYQLPALSTYIERVKRCDFSHINVFLVASVPGSHFDTEWGMTRVGALLRQHCAIPGSETKQWPVLAQASSIGSFGKEPNLWLTGDFLHHFSKISDQPQMLSSPAAIKIIYPSLENVQGSHDGLLGGGCLPYAASAHIKQTWLNEFLYQWRATSTVRDRAMPHIKSYTRVSPDSRRAAYFLLTSGNVSKAAWGSINKGNAALRIMSYEAGVLFLPTFIINADFFPLREQERNRLVLPYDVPPVKYTKEMSPWVSDYLMG